MTSISIETAIVFLAQSIVWTCGVVAFSFLTFATKRELEKTHADVKALRDEVGARLVRIEDMITRILERGVDR